MLGRSLLIGSVMALVASPVDAQQRWHSTHQLGFAELGTGFNTRNSIVISCNVSNDTVGGSDGVDISINVNSRKPSNNSAVRVFVDGSMFEFFVRNDDIKTGFGPNGRAFRKFSDAMKKNPRNLRVLFQNGETATFPTRGAAKLFRDETCV